MKMTLVLTPKELLAAAKYYATENLGIPHELAEKMTLEWFNLSTGKYEDCLAPANAQVIRAEMLAEADHFDNGPYR